MPIDLQNLEIPRNVDAEKTILGALLLDAEAFQAVKIALKPKDFSLSAHQQIIAAMAQIEKRNASIDLVTLSEELNRRKLLDSIGGVSYLASLTEGLPRRPVIDEYIRIVKDKSLARQMITQHEEAIRMLAEQTDPAIEVGAYVDKLLKQIMEPHYTGQNSKASDLVLAAADAVNEQYRARTSPRIPSGNDWFDSKTGGGYRRGKTTIVAARPKIGKTAWAIKSVAELCLRGIGCSLHSLEMDTDEVLQNLVPYVTNLPNSVVTQPWLQTPEQNQLVNVGLGIIADWPLWIHTSTDLDEICWMIDRDCDKNDCKLVAVDHATLVTTKARDTRERVNEVSGRIRKKIKTKDAALLLLCQLRKVSREYADKPPVLDDIKETGNLLEDCYAAVILHRPWDKENRRTAYHGQIDLAAVRGGGATTGTADAKFNTHKLCFEAEAQLGYDSYYQ